jgi:methionyl-tRNA formyltransferase/peptidoglycan/xylan/chitin deacetylase (PgdA/CDA1 family)
VKKVVILTTRTPHHAYFIDRIAEEFQVAAVFYETRRARPASPAGPVFDEQEAEFEARHFPDAVSGIPEHNVETVNAAGVAERIAAYEADIGIVFGCGKIRPHVFGSAKAGLINVHRGISEKYRGLDSDLWAIHHDDIDHIGVTIHKVAEELDTGDICRSAALPNVRSLRTHQLRYFTTVLAAELVLEVLRGYAASGHLDARPQRRGKYFSYMPLELKREARRKFDSDGAKDADDGYQAGLFCFDKRIYSQLCILLYHGVTRERGRGIENFARKHLEADVFEEQMRYVAQECRLLTMEEVSRLCARKAPFPPKAVAVTFDDAFENVYSVAYPILRMHSVPFTFYVSTGFVETDRLFWVDIIEDCINRSRREEIALPTYDRPLPLRSAEERMAACRSVKRRCKQSENSLKDEIIAALIRESGVTPDPKASAGYRMIRWTQLAEMARDPLAIVGSHSHSHNILSRISQDELRSEVATSVAMLEERLDRPVRHFSYPEGGPEHFNVRVIDELKARGIVCCPTAIPGLNARGTDPFLLRRVMVGFEGLPFPYTDEVLNPAELPKVYGSSGAAPAWAG